MCDTINNPNPSVTENKQYSGPNLYTSEGAPIIKIDDNVVAVIDIITGNLEAFLPARKYSSMDFCLPPENRKTIPITEGIKREIIMII
ncbi:hypothetical protein TNIN_426751 [Trichonephila inaurata madagascariensis]|uniref:Uncharacterized protein n=1 Tax=Trichonephila inaurata madagascariensis TaxID=2747483 RepID=A0A8X6YMV6_9ARAC|nr:hypothetical protein TNIN_426751 [Trichonephila inaurata madagascariensis]